MHNRSFFRFPLLIVTIYFSLKLTIFLFFLKTEWNALILGQLFSMVFPSLLYFIVAVFCCSKYCLHDAKDSSWIILIALLFAGFSIVLGQYLWIPIKYINDFMITLAVPRIVTGTLYALLRYALHILALILLFKVIAGSSTTKRTPLQLDALSSKKIHMTLYAVITVLVLLLPMSINIRYYILQLSIEYEFYGESYILWLFPAFLVGITLQCLLLYAGSYRYFSELDAPHSTLTISKLFKSVGLTTVFILVGILLLTIAILLLGWLVVLVLPLNLFTGLLLSVILNCAIFFYSARMAVKIVYA